MKEKIKSVIKVVFEKKAVVSAFLASFMVTIFTVVANAEVVEAIDITTTMETSFTKVVNDLLKMLATVLPIGLTVFGATIAVAFAIKWFKKLTGGTSTGS